MAHKEVSIAVFGIVVGTMLGAGSILLGRDVSSFAANVGGRDAEFVAYRQGFIFEDQYRKRSISDMDKRVRPQARVRTGGAMPASVPEDTGMPVLDPAECVMKVRIAEELRAIVIPIIPGRAIDLLVRSSVQKGFDDYIADCLPYYKESMMQPEGDMQMELRNEPAATFGVDPEYCDRYTGSRRSRCIAEQRDNQIQYQDHR